MHLKSLWPLSNMELDLYCMWLSGKWSEKQDWDLGFKLWVSEWQDPEADAGAVLCPRASCPTALVHQLAMLVGEVSESMMKVRWKNSESQGPESALPHRISSAAGCNVAHCSHTPAIRALASTRSHCGLFYNLEPHVAFKNVFGNQAPSRSSWTFFSANPLAPSSIIH